MGKRVPLARRNMLADKRRLAASLAGVGFALMLILLLDGMWAGIFDQVTVYERNVGADLYVAQPGTKNFLGDVSVIPTSTLDTTRADPDVRWASRVRGQFVILELHDHKVPVYLIGSVPDEPGGPWSMAEGRAPAADNETAVDSVVAGRHGLAVGDTLTIMGKPFEIVGLAGESSAFMAGMVFVTHSATDELLSSPGTTSYVLVGTDSPAEVRDRLDAAGLAVIERDELAANDVELMTGVFGVPLKLMVGVAFAAGTLVIALTTYTSVVERRREYGIVKAMGGDGSRLILLVVEQTLLLAVLGLAAGGVLFIAGRSVIAWYRPQFAVIVTAGGLIRTLLAAVVMGLVAALIPARRLAAIEPASVYRGG